MIEVAAAGVVLRAPGKIYGWSVRWSVGQWEVIQKLVGPRKLHWWPERAGSVVLGRIQDALGL